MKRIFAILFLLLMVFAFAMPVLAEAVADEPAPPATSPWTWSFLATIAGATAATLLITQFLKIPLDHVWKIPTRLVVYLIALIIMAISTAYTTGLTVDSFLLTVLNAFIVALAAYGSYELTFAKLDK